MTKKKEKVLSPEQAEAKRLSEKHLTYVEIGQTMGVSTKQAKRLIDSANKKFPHLHIDGVLEINEVSNETKEAAYGLYLDGLPLWNVAQFFGVGRNLIGDWIEDIGGVIRDKVESAVNGANRSEFLRLKQEAKAKIIKPPKVEKIKKPKVVKEPKKPKVKKVVVKKDKQLEITSEMLEAKKLYEEGWLTSELVAHFNVSHSVMYRWFRKTNTKQRPIGESRKMFWEKARNNPEITDDMLIARKMYLDNNSIRDIAKHFKVGYYIVKKWLDFTKTPIRDGKEALQISFEKQRSKVTPEMILVKELYEQKLSVAEIVDITGLHRDFIYAAIPRAGGIMRSNVESAALSASKGRRKVRGIQTIVTTRFGEIHADSTFEAVFLQKMDKDETIFSLKRANPISFKTGNYIPDFHIVDIYGNSYIIEVKPENLRNSIEVVEKELAALKYYGDKNIGYHVVTELEIGKKSFEEVDISLVKFHKEADEKRFIRSIKTTLYRFNKIFE